MVKFDQKIMNLERRLIFKSSISINQEIKSNSFHTFTPPKLPNFSHTEFPRLREFLPQLGERDSSTPVRLYDRKLG